MQLINDKLLCNSTTQAAFLFGMIAQTSAMSAQKPNMVSEHNMTIVFTKDGLPPSYVAELMLPGVLVYPLQKENGLNEQKLHEIFTRVQRNDPSSVLRRNE
jgi:hypothetical protein